MKKVILYIAMTLDGMIADSNDGLSFLEPFDGLTWVKDSYEALLSKTDTILMGRRTFEVIQSFDLPWPYPDHPCYVYGQKKMSSKVATFIHEDATTHVTRLKTHKAKDIWLVGGGKLIQSLLETKMIDEMIITQFQHIVSRFLDPLIPAVVTIGTIEGGEARNIIAQTVRLSGTIRTFDQDTYDTIKQSMKAIIQGIEVGYGLSIQLDIRDYYPAVTNDHVMYTDIVSLLNQDEYEIIKPMMFAEDFSFYQKVVPGLFMMLGTRNEQLNYVHPLHSCYFNFKEDVLPKAISLYDRISKLYNIYE